MHRPKPHGQCPPGIYNIEGAAGRLLQYFRRQRFQTLRATPAARISHTADVTVYEDLLMMPPPPVARMNSFIAISHSGPY